MVAYIFCSTIYTFLFPSDTNRQLWPWKEIIFFHKPSTVSRWFYFSGLPFHQSYNFPSSTRPDVNSAAVLQNCFIGVQLKGNQAEDDLLHSVLFRVKHPTHVGTIVATRLTWQSTRNIIKSSSAKFLLVGSRIRENFACGIWNPGHWNLKYGSRKPEFH